MYFLNTEWWNMRKTIKTSEQTNKRNLLLRQIIYFMLLTIFGQKKVGFIFYIYMI